jgi:hypothetical protein
MRVPVLVTVRRWGQSSQDCSNFVCPSIIVSADRSNVDAEAHVFRTMCLGALRASTAGRRPKCQDWWTALDVLPADLNFGLTRDGLIIRCASRRSAITLPCLDDHGLPGDLFSAT